jgi:nucleoside-diphosphate-sugar epimerase
MMRGTVAVTGATGFVGAAVVHQLAISGWRVRVLARRMPRAALLPDQEIEVVLGDLEDSSRLEQLATGVEAIIHCAGLVKALTPLEFFAVNEGGTERLMRAAQLAAPSARLIHVSSLAAREPSLSPYAASKRAAENKVMSMAGERDWIALRPPAIYGPGDLELLPLFKAAKMGLVAYPASADARVSLLHVADLASAIAALLAQPSWPAGIVEVDDGTPRGYDWPQILSALGAAVGLRPRACRLPLQVFFPIAAGATLLAKLIGRPQVLSLRKLAELYHPDWVVQGPVLSGMVNWHPKYTLTHGFADTVAWYRQESYL